MPAFDGDFYTPEVTTLSKGDLVGSLVVLTTKKFNGEFPGSFGTTERWEGDVLVVSGPLSGKVYPDTTFMGLLASQLSSVPVGRTGVAHIVNGKTRTGNVWVGADFSVTAEDTEAARAAVTASSEVAPF